MPNKRQFQDSIFRVISGPATAALALAILFALTLVLAQPAQGQTYQVIHNFTNGEDGAAPYAGVMIDASGNLYGTTLGGGTDGAGVVFRMIRKNSNWVLTTLHAFKGGDDGMYPVGGVIRDANGALYGTTARGGNSVWGTVFKLSPSPAAPGSVTAPWTESILYNFTNGSDGGAPWDAVVFDQAGDIYGTTQGGGDFGWGTVFQLTPSNGRWTESVLHSFSVNNDGGDPIASVVFDKAGNLYGTATVGGGYLCGSVFQLMPSGSGWTATTLHTFTGWGNGCEPQAGVILDQAGNLYGATLSNGSDERGTDFELSPSNGTWNFSLLYAFNNGNGGSRGGGCGAQGPRGSISSLTLSSGGELYGTTIGNGAYASGNVFKLTPSTGGWTYTSLHDFTGADDGGTPCGGVTLDESGNLYGTANAGGTDGYGVVWEITP